jgi:hypothetical protein
MTRSVGRAIASVLFFIAAARAGWAGTGTPGPTFEISFPTSASSGPITGRLFLLISRVNEPEVRLQGMWVNSPEVIGLDVRRLRPGQTAVVDSSALGTPLESLKDVPPGDYYVQAVLSVSTEFRRADGHVIWAHDDRGEGQQFTHSPGNLYSPVERLHLDRSSKIDLTLTQAIPPIPVPPDTAWVKHIRIQSALLTKFWGRPIYLGAVVLLPRDYAIHPNLNYPVIYYQPEHFRAFPPFEFRTDSPSETTAAQRDRERGGWEGGYEFYRSWNADHFPRMIAVSIQTPTPWSDWSGGVDSANNGPYGAAITQELIPYVEHEFRIIRETYARMLCGKHTGGTAALGLQLQHADFFGGAWIFHPAAFNFQSFFGWNIYENDNAYIVKPSDLEWGRNPSEWLPVERFFTRTSAGISFVSFRQAGRHDAVMAGVGDGDPIGEYDAILGPVGKDGYPKLMFDRMTGAVDREVANYWREHGDLLAYTQRNWSRIGPHLNGKLHFYIGEMDQFFRQFGVHSFEEFLKTTADPHANGFFTYIPLKGSWQPMSNAALVKIMAEYVADHSPKNASTEWLSP